MNVRHAAVASRRWLIPEVVQTSAMDCGPASLHALLRGFGLPSSYGRLREACQTDIDGTSIDTIEDVANLLGLEAEQILLPADWVVLPEANVLPAVVVLRLANGLTHFAVVWRRHGRWLQLMDPACGRRWVRDVDLVRELYVHHATVPAADWAQWARSSEARAMLAARLRALGVRDAIALVDRAACASDWIALARLDAATRVVNRLVDGRALRRGADAEAVLGELIARDQQGDAGTAIPEVYWSAWEAGNDPESGPSVQVSGAVLVRVRGVKPPDRDSLQSLPELAAAAVEPEPRPIRTVLELLESHGRVARVGLVVVAALTAAAMFVEVLLLRSLVDLSAQLGLSYDRVAMILAFSVLACALMGVEWGVHMHAARLGRQIELVLRRRFAEKLPRLPDRYMHSRPVSDMAKRCHDLHEVRVIPTLFVRLGAVLGAILVAIVGIIWIAPDLWPWALCAGGVALAIPLGFRPALEERDLRVRTHAGALGQFYLDAVFAHSAIRAHGAEQNVDREHEALMVDWARAAWQRAHAVIGLTITQMAIGTALAGWMLYRYTQVGGEAHGVLLLAYWAAALPAMGEELAYLLRRIPAVRNTTLRLLEPLAAPDDASMAIRVSVADSNTPVDALVSLTARGYPAPISAGSNPSTDANTSEKGVKIEFSGVRVVSGGHLILRDIDLVIEPGEHVAIVGRSGAGKSTLLGVLLGWHRTAAGEARVDGSLLTPDLLARVRSMTVWVDPEVYLWNRSFIENLRYGVPASTVADQSAAITQAELVDVLKRLERGMASRVGESGRRLSGGEGQRLRLGRGFVRQGTRLVLLDEPFRGLERDRRRRLLLAARRHWAQATLLIVTHDVEETLDMPRVLVVEDGRIVEDGDPRVLVKADSRYAALVADERAARLEVWGRSAWRRLVVANGRVIQ